AALIATTEDEGTRKAAEARFWVLYWGPLAAVEDVGVKIQGNPKIEVAMVNFGEEIKKKPEERDKGTMQSLSLKLAHAIKEAIKPAFDVTGPEPLGLRK